MQGIDDRGCPGPEIHSHTLIWTVISKGSPLLLEYDEVPNSQECVFRNMEVEELSAGKGAERTQLSR